MGTRIVDPRRAIPCSVLPPAEIPLVLEPTNISSASRAARVTPFRGFVRGHIAQTGDGDHRFTCARRTDIIFKQEFQ